MHLSNADIMQSARTYLKGRWGIPIGACVIFILIFAGLGLIPVAGWIADVLISGSLVIGLYSIFLGIVRNKYVTTGQLFSGFQYFGNALAAYIVMIIFVVLWALLLIVPGIIAAYAYSQTYYIMLDNKNIDGLTAIRKSKELMMGNKWKLFCLECRFIGWLLLCIVTLGIALIWVVPYWLASHAKFYDDISGVKAAPGTI